MGNDQATLLQKDTNRLNAAKYIQISAKHNKKIIHQNLKSLKQFTTVIKSIYLRTTYLKYDWAQWLCAQLKRDPNKLYEQYCQMFTLSLMKKNEASQNFNIKNFRVKFILGLENHAKKIQQINFQLEELQKLFEEVKCYFMVENWFFELPLNSYFKNHQATWSSSAKQNEHKSKGELFFTLKSCDSTQKSNHPEKVYRILIKLTEIYFLSIYNVEDQFVPNECESPKHNPMKRFNSREYQLIKTISRESSFKLREGLIYQLLDSIFKFDEMPKDKVEISVLEHKKLYALTRVLGLKNVYCVLKILVEIGQIPHIEQIQIIFNHIAKNMLDPNPIKDQHRKQIKQNMSQKVSPNKKKPTQSPEKKRQNSKMKTQSIR